MQHRLTLLFLLRVFVFLLIASAAAMPYDGDEWGKCMAMCDGDTMCAANCESFLNAVGDYYDFSGSGSGWDYSGDYSGSGSGWDYSGSDGWDDGLDYSGSSSGWDNSGSGSGSGYYYDYI